MPQGDLCVHGSMVSDLLNPPQNVDTGKLDQGWLVSHSKMDLVDLKRLVIL